MGGNCTASSSERLHEGPQRLGISTHKRSTPGLVGIANCIPAVTDARGGNPRTGQAVRRPGAGPLIVAFPIVVAGAGLAWANRIAQSSLSIHPRPPDLIPRSFGRANLSLPSVRASCAIPFEGKREWPPGSASRSRSWWRSPSASTGPGASSSFSPWSAAYPFSTPDSVHRRIATKTARQRNPAAPGFAPYSSQPPETTALPKFHPVQVFPDVPGSPKCSEASLPSVPRHFRKHVQEWISVQTPLTARRCHLHWKCDIFISRSASERRVPEFHLRSSVCFRLLGR